MQPRVLILRAPGTNCDHETAFAFEQAGGRAERVHVNRLLENVKLLDEFQILCIPGGFCYGDDLAAGRILAAQIRRRLLDALSAFRDAGRLVLGICNGFQALLQTGILLPDDEHGPTATLAQNQSAKFEDRWVQLRVEGDRCVFLAGIEQMYLPVAHAEGQFVARNQAVLDRLAAAGQCVLRYDRPAGSTSPGEGVPYPENPNGSMTDIAGVCDQTGRIFGLMPHPERFIDPTHHPRWTREPRRPRGDGFGIFENAVNHFR